MRITCPTTNESIESPVDSPDVDFACPSCGQTHRLTVDTSPSVPPSLRGLDIAPIFEADPERGGTGGSGVIPLLDIGGGHSGGRADSGVDAFFSAISSEMRTAPPPIRPIPGLDPVTTGAGDLDSSAPGIRPLPEDASPEETSDSLAPAREDSFDYDATESGFRPAETPSERRRMWEVPLRQPAHGHYPENIPPSPEPVYGDVFFSDFAQIIGEQEDDFSFTRQGSLRSLSWRLPAAIAAVLLLVALFFAWRQLAYSRHVGEAESLLAAAAAGWAQGDADGAADAARAAGDSLDHAAGISTLGRIWRGLFGGDDPHAAMNLRVQEVLARYGSFEAFRHSIQGADPLAMAQALQESGAKAGRDPALQPMLERTVIAASLDRLRIGAARISPETVQAEARVDLALLGPVLSGDNGARYAGEIHSLIEAQRERLAAELRRDLEAVYATAAYGDPGVIRRYRTLKERAAAAGLAAPDGSLEGLAAEENGETLRQLEDLSDVLDKARAFAGSVLSLEGSDESDINRQINKAIDDLAAEARALNTPHASLAAAAAEMVEAARTSADELLGLRLTVSGRLQSEMRRSRDYAGTRLAWSMLRMAFDDPDIAIDPAEFRFDSTRASMAFTIGGLPGLMEMAEADYENNIRARIAGYRFTAGWSPLLRKPVTWMAEIAAAMRASGVDAESYPEWELMEGPGGPLALSIPGSAGMPGTGIPGERQVFFQGRLRPAAEIAPPADSQRMVESFVGAARRLHDRVMSENSISPALRQALKPVLMGTYQKPDPRDYFDSAFCRRLIEADYLETFIRPMPDAVARRLHEYREALDQLEAGYDEFSVELDDGSRLFAVVRADADITGEGRASDQDPETGETMPRLTWRVEKAGETVFYTPQPSRFIYAFWLADHYDGLHHNRPQGVPKLSEVWHVTRGLIASYRDGDSRAEGDPEMWNEAIALDSNGRYDPSSGPPGWNYPMHVLQRDHEGDPVLLATPSGTVRSPDFSSLADDDEARRAAEDAWLDSTAETLATAGELGLIFHQFFRYCSDSPLPELPNLIGSHFGLSDTHQTVYESLERRWVGRLIGDCDDLAEMFQVLTRRQGKLSHVMQLPGHAAAGWVEEAEDGMYRFTILQTGPVQQFLAPTLNDAVEVAYRSFDRGDGISHLTTDAVPLLLRFADEETRTPFVLSARIYGDADYADTMITVQSYWHEHVYSAAIKVMEKMVEDDPEIGSIKELGSLYERVGFYEDSARMRARELEMVRRDDPQATVSTLLEIAQLHFQDKNREKALEALTAMEQVFESLIAADDAPEFFRLMTFRSYWAMYLSRLGEAARAWDLVGYDVIATKRQLGRMADPVLRTLVFMHDRLSMERAAAGGALPPKSRRAMEAIRTELDEAFGRGYFRADDSYNGIIGRYFTLGRYAVAELGREKGLERLLEDGPYATAAKDQTKRSKGLEEEDWSWLRITPQLYLAYGSEMLDMDEYPELYNPEGAKPILEMVARAVEKGAGLGSDVAGGDDAVKAELTLSFLNRDLDAFRRSMATVKEKDYSSLYDDAAMTFGMNCGLVPVEEFSAWMEAFREFFPGSQHYFKVVYRALDKEHYDHALAMAEATANFFPDHELFQEERDFIRSVIPELKARQRQEEKKRAAEKKRPAA